MELQFTVQAKIRRPVEEVFQAVYDPKQITKYFATESASAPLDEGTRVMWRFADFPADVWVEVTKTVPNERIEFTWEASEGGYQTHVRLEFESLGERETLLKISESGWRDDEKGRKSSYGNCEGWTNMQACLKAWLEYGINLREGYY